MLDKFSTGLLFRSCLLLMLVPLGLRAQVKITSPVERAIYQREINGSATVSITGNYTAPVDKIEIRATPVIDGQGAAIGWTVLQENPTGGVFAGTLRLLGGWYSIEARGSKGGVQVGQTFTLSRMGVGEVFMISGQSNAQGIDYTSPAATDDRVNYINQDNSVNSLSDPPYPVFARVDSKIVTMGPRGKGAWCWGLLGDLLTKQLNVPILFINTAWEGTAVKNWRESSEGIRTQSPYGFYYPDQMPYANLRISMQHYAKEFGVRAILWMQGESDTYPLATSYDDYKNHMQTLMNNLSGDINARINWVIARTSRTANDKGVSITSPSVIGAQNAVIDALFSSAVAGPETDNLFTERADGTHFQGTTGVTILANAWYGVLNNNFFATVTPLTLASVPKITSTCAANNTSVILSLPEGYASYTWQNGATGRTLTVTAPGEYSALVKDSFGNTVHSQKLVIESSIKPATPTINQSGSQQACADSAFVFSLTGNDAYTWYKQNSSTALATGSTYAAKEAGSYVVRSQNVFGCTSDVSAASSLIFREAIAKPTIEKSGPFTIMASIPQAGMNEQYDWKRGDKILASHANIVKTDTSGKYAARAKVTYTLAGNSLTCYSPYSDSQDVVTNEMNDVVVFPNPGLADDIYVESRDDMKNAEITVYDIFGRVVVSQKQDLTSRVKIQVQNLSTGKYIIRIKNDDVDLVKQIMIR